MTIQAIAGPPLEEGAELPRYRYWGNQKPPEKKSDFFSCKVTNAAAAAESGATTAGGSSSGSVATMRMYGPIDPWGGYWGISARDVAETLDALDDGVTEIRVRINSPGGSVWEAMAILNMFRAHRAKVLAVVDGIAASAASYIAAGVNETVMSPGTEMMIHDASGMAFGPASVMEKVKKALDSMSNSIASIYSEAAGGTVEEWRARMLEETWYTAAESVEAGLADRVAVVPDAGATETAGDPEEEPDLEEEFEDRFDLSIYAYAGRSHAPAPGSLSAAAVAAPKPPTASADGSTQPEGAAVVDLNDEQIASLRAQVGFAEDADADTIVAAVREALNERASDDTPSTPAVPEGMALVDAEVLKQIQADAAAGRTAQTTLATQARDAAIDKALAEGKIAATSKDKFVEAWDKDATSTKAILDALTPGLVPTAENGHEDEPTALGAGIEIDDAELDAFAASLGLNKEALRG